MMFKIERKFQDAERSKGGNNVIAVEHTKLPVILDQRR